MEVRNVSQVSFQATVPKRLRTRLANEAFDKSMDVLNKMIDKFEQVEGFGDKASEIILGRTEKEGDLFLELINNTIAPFRRVALPRKGSLMESFFALTERDIVNAENKLSHKV